MTENDNFNNKIIKPKRGRPFGTTKKKLEEKKIITREFNEKNTLIKVTPEQDYKQPLYTIDGRSVNNAIIVRSSEQEIQFHLNKIFGNDVDDYYILGENTVNRNNKQIKIFLIEDKNGYRYTYFFDTTNIAMKFKYY